MGLATAWREDGDLVRAPGLVALHATRGLAAWGRQRLGGGFPGRCQLLVPGYFSRSTAPPPYYRNNVALDATGVRVAGMADAPGAGGHEEDSLAITERYRIR